MTRLGWNTSWSIVALCSLARAGDPKEFDGKPASYWMDRLASGGEDALAALVAIGPACVPELLDRLTGGSGNGPYVSAIRAMGASALPLVFEQIRQGPPDRKIAALWFVLEGPRTRERDEMLSPLLSDADEDVRVRAAYLLATHNVFIPGVVSLLIEASKSESAERRMAAVSGLSHMSDASEAVVNALIQASTDPEPGVAEIALTALARYWAEPKARAAIIAATWSLQTANRVAAAGAVSAIAQPTDELVQLCLRLAFDDAVEVREEALRSLEWFWIDRRFPLGLHREALTHPNAEVRRLACRAALNGAREAPGDLIARLKDREPCVRHAAVEALLDLGDASDPAAKEAMDSAVAHLVVDMNSVSGPDRAARIRAIGGIGPAAQSAIPAIRHWLDATDPETRMEAAYALHLIAGDTRACIATLETNLRQGGAPAIVYATRIAQRLGAAAQGLSPSLVSALRHDDPWVRRNAALALGCVRAPIATTRPELRRLLDDRETATSVLDAPCFAAAASLTLLGDSGPEIERLMKSVFGAGDGAFDLEPEALRYAWGHGTAVGVVVERAADRLQRGPSALLVTDLQLVALLGDIGPLARQAVPAIEACSWRRRIELRAASSAALRRIGGER